MKRISTAVMAMIIPALIFQGCGEKSEQDGETTTNTSAAVEAGAGGVAITVNGKEITGGEIDHEVRLMMQQMGGRVSPDQMQSMASAVKQQAVNNIINRTLLRGAAERDNIPATDEDIAGRIDQIKSNFDTEEAFTNQLESSGLTMEAFNIEIRYTIMIETLMEKITANLTGAGEVQAREFYDSNTDRFAKPEQIKASHILIKVAPEDTDAIKSDKRNRLAQLKSKIDEGADFATLASENSDCPSSSNGGDLGFFGRGQMVKPFDDAAFALSTGEISEIVETRFGYHVIKVTEKSESTMTPFETVKDEIVQYLDGMNKQAEVEKYVAALKDLATIEFADSSLIQ
ncbi:MAG: peptidylprolyl isomerase [Bacteroidales bacterium]|nr:peptidylprolyl isomerase [Candidatus Latescibacterota bacterium]